MHMVTFVNDKQELHLCMILELPTNVTPMSTVLNKFLITFCILNSFDSRNTGTANSVTALS